MRGVKSTVIFASVNGVAYYTDPKLRRTSWDLASSHGLPTSWQ